MDPTKFDAFTKALATPISRRQAFKKTMAATAAAAGVFLGLGRVGDASAKPMQPSAPCTKFGRPCDPKRANQCCSNMGCFYYKATKDNKKGYICRYRRLSGSGPE